MGLSLKWEGYYLEFLTPQTFNTEDENGENVLHLEITESLIAHSNSVIFDNQQDSRVLCTCVPNKIVRSIIKYFYSTALYF